MYGIIRLIILMKIINNILKTKRPSRWGEDCSPPTRLPHWEVTWCKMAQTQWTFQWSWTDSAFGIRNLPYLQPNSNSNLWNTWSNVCKHCPRVCINVCSSMSCTTHLGSICSCWFQMCKNRVWKQDLWVMSNITCVLRSTFTKRSQMRELSTLNLPHRHLSFRKTIFVIEKSKRMFR